jgi:hypothetical protein
MNHKLQNIRKEAVMVQSALKKKSSGCTGMLYIIDTIYYNGLGRSQWPRGLKHELSSPA